MLTISAQSASPALITNNRPENMRDFKTDRCLVLDRFLGSFPPDFYAFNPENLEYCRVKSFLQSSRFLRQDGLFVHTAFQPIFSFAHKRIVGYEALARTGNSPPPFFQTGTFEKNDLDPVFMVFVDRLCRLVHARNFNVLGDGDNWLFMNIAPQTIMYGIDYGPYFKEMLADCSIPPYRVVIEIVEDPIMDSRRINRTVDYYREIGCLVAIDDFGAGHSNFERVWELSPDIIKLDRSMIMRADQQPRIRALLPDIVTLLHQAGALVLMEGVETEAQALIALEADVDLVQGYYFARPLSVFENSAHPIPPFDDLFKKFKSGIVEHSHQLDLMYDQHKKAFYSAVEKLKSGQALEEAVEPLFQIRDTMRCYLLQPDGVQAGRNLVSPLYRQRIDIRFTPLQSAVNADWFRRHYLRKAVLNPGRPQLSQPYLSITGENMCVTASVMFMNASGMKYVFCCDFLWES